MRRETTTGNDYGDYNGLSFSNGRFSTIWTDNSAALQANHDRPSFDMAAASVAVNADGSVSVGPTVDVSPLQGNQSEGAIGINPLNPENLIALSNNNEDFAMVKSYSTDGGKTWHTDEIADGNDAFPPSCCDPTVSFDQYGNCFIGYLTDDTSHAVILLSTDGGATFSHLKTLGLDGSAGGTGIDQPTLVTGPDGTGKGSIWVLFQQSGSTVPDGNALSVCGARVTGLGVVDAFSQYYAPGTNNKNFGDIAVGPHGEVMITYQDNRGDEGPDNIYFNVDPDGLGSTPMGPSITVTSTNVGDFDFIPPQPARSVDAEVGLAWDRSGGPHNGRVYMIYTDEVVNEFGQHRHRAPLFRRHREDVELPYSVE